MKRDFITFRSITPAQQAQHILRRGGIETILQRTPRCMEQRGCGYCLRLRPEDREQAVLLLQRSGVRFQKLYTEENGIAEEASYDLS